MSKEDPNVTVARFSYKQAIIVAFITGATTLGGTLLTLRSSGKEDASTPDLSSSLESCQSEKEQLTNELSNSLTFSTLADISNQYFKRDAKEEEVKNAVRSLIGSANQFKADKQHFTYKLFQLKKRMLVNGGNINVRISSVDPNACSLIQDLLKGIEYYRGTIDGNAESTRAAVENFQRSLNRYTPGYFEEKNLGIVGKKTFNAILERYEKND